MLGPYSPVATTWAELAVGRTLTAQRLQTSMALRNMAAWPVIVAHHALEPYIVVGTVVAASSALASLAAGGSVRCRRLVIRLAAARRHQKITSWQDDLKQLQDN